MLERPFNEVLATGKPDFPFMLCWANENWTRTWDGQDKHVLLEQKYSEDDDRAHIRSLIPVFKDPRYIKVKGKPVFSIYKSHLLPNPSKTIQIWREEARKHGIELYLCCFESFGNYGKIMMEPGYDAAVDFQPFSKELDKYFQHYFKRKTKNNFLLKVKQKYFKLTNQSDKGNLLMNTYRSFLYGKMDYNKWVDYLKANYLFSNEYVKYPGATPAWDNTARKGENGFMLHNANPQKFKEWLSFIYDNYKPPTEDENFIFINAWNEWAEGNHLEPCVKFGHQNLDAVKEVFSHDA